MPDDRELLRQYAFENSETAFTEFVRRHVDVVYGSALRRLRGDAHLAAEVTQTVFTELSRKAAVVSRHGAPIGWLYVAVRHASAQAARSEARRRAREDLAFRMEHHHDRTTWADLQPLIDGAIDQLESADQTVLLLRFFEDLPLAEVGRQLELSEDAARKRVSRALERLRAILVRSGITCPSAVLGTTLANQGGMMAPTGLSAMVSASALRSTGTASSVFNSIALGKFAAVVLVAAVALAVFFADGRRGAREARPAETATRAAAGAEAGPTTVHRVEANRSSTPAQNSPTLVASFKATLAGEAPSPGPVPIAPLTRAEMLHRARENLDNLYRPLFHQLDLPPEDLEQLKDLLVIRQGIFSDARKEAKAHGLSEQDPDPYWEFLRASQEAVNDAIKALLKEERYGLFTDFEGRLTKNVTVMILQNALKDVAPLSDEQRIKLVDVLIKDGLTHYPMGLSLEQGAGLKTPPLGGIAKKAVVEAADFLSPPQIDALDALRTAIRERVAAQAAIPAAGAAKTP